LPLRRTTSRSVPCSGSSSPASSAWTAATRITGTWTPAPAGSRQRAMPSAARRLGHRSGARCGAGRAVQRRHLRATKKTGVSPSLHRPSRSRNLCRWPATQRLARCRRPIHPLSAPRPAEAVGLARSVPTSVRRAPLPARSSASWHSGCGTHGGALAAVRVDGAETDRSVRRLPQLLREARSNTPIPTARMPVPMTVR
jgi:hypothetical protein